MVLNNIYCFFVFMSFIFFYLDDGLLIYFCWMSGERVFIFFRLYEELFEDVIDVD